MNFAAAPGPQDVQAAIVFSDVAGCDAFQNKLLCATARTIPKYGALYRATPIAIVTIEPLPMLAHVAGQGVVTLRAERRGVAVLYLATVTPIGVNHSLQERADFFSCLLQESQARS